MFEAKTNKLQLLRKKEKAIGHKNNIETKNNLSYQNKMFSNIQCWFADFVKLFVGMSQNSECRFQTTKSFKKTKSI